MRKPGSGEIGWLTGINHTTTGERQLAIRTYTWIARQPFNIRYMPSTILSDGSPESDRFIEDHKSSFVDDKPVFKKGDFWPSLILVEKSWEDTSKKETGIFIRVYKRKIKLLIDVYQGDDMDLITTLNEQYKVPIYRITTSKRGKRGSVQKLLDFHN